MQKSTCRSYCVAVLFLAGFVQLPALAQQPVTGKPPYGSFSGGPFDVINNANLNAHFEIPVFQRDGRGIPFSYKLSYDSAVWYPAVSGPSTVWTPVNNWGWRAITEAETGYVSYQASVNNCMGHAWTTYANWQYHDQWGAIHGVAIAVSDYQSSYGCGTIGFPPTTATGTANDGSGYVMSVSALSGVSVTSLRATNGVSINAPLQLSTGSGSFTDTNGNQISITSGTTTSFFDTLSSTTAALTASGGAAPGNPTILSYTAPFPTTASVQVKYSAYTVQTAFGCSAVGEFGAQTKNLVSSIVLPDGTSYTFSYEPTPGQPANVTGRLASVTLPTGGTIGYAYSGGSQGIICANGTTATLKRTTPDGGTQYVHNESSSPWTTTLTEIGTVVQTTTMSFQGIYETQRQLQQNGTVLATIDTCYNGAAAPCTTTGVSLPIIQVDATTTLGTGSSTIKSKHTAKYDSTSGVLKETDDYDFGGVNGAAGSLLRKTVIAYASLGNGIADRPLTVTIFGSDGVTQAAKTTYSYDETIPTTTSSPQHVGVSGARGNATTVKRETSASTSTALSQTYSYFDTGTVQTATDVNGAQTTYTYGACGNSFPTNAALPLSLSRAAAWNCTGAVTTSVTDEHSGTVSTAYTDASFWRPSSVTDQTSKVTTLTYPVAQVASESTLNFNTTSTADVRTTLDKLWRSNLRQIKQGPTATNYDSVQTTYDNWGRPYRVSVPYSATAGTASSGPWNLTSYDVLNRPTQVTDANGGWTKYTYTLNDVLVEVGPAATGENTKKRMLEYDGLGQLKSVCEVLATGGSGCGQHTAANGQLTSYTRDALGNVTGVTQGVQTRTYTFDQLSRLTSEKNPETNGSIVSYVYDTDATCGTSKGDMVKRTDVMTPADVTCYAFDALHRVTAVTYPSGSYASVTPEKHYVYDAATVNGTAMTNAKARLAEAYTGPSTGKITDLGFSYTARGEVSATYQSSAHSGGFYKVAASYWDNGLRNTLQLATPNVNTWTYGADGEGRANDVKANGPTTVVSSTAYNTFSLPTSVNFGSLDSDTLSYDANMGRMTQYKATVNGSAVFGTLTWNTNGMLGSVATTDPFNAANNGLNCVYKYDDLARISTVNCGNTKWGQGFTYDQWGNINKGILSVLNETHTGTSFTASYNSSTNRVTTSGTAWSYDANGNILNDGFHTYTWDAEGRARALDSTTFVSDALGRRVEQTVGAATTEILYGPGGEKLGLMNGQTVTKLFVPLPGQATAVYTAGGLSVYRHADWLGSSRVTSTPARTVSYDTSYAPFGEAFNETGTTDRNYTGQNANVAPDTYDFLFREYNSIQGRWVSPDPLGVGAVDASNPQSWNRYAYVLGNPLNYKDPTGLEAYWSGGCLYDRVSYYVDGQLDSADNYLITCSPGGGGGRPAPQGGGGGPKDSSPQDKAAVKLACAADFGQNHSIAAAFGAQNNFVAGLFGGNSVSSLVNLGLFISGAKTPTVQQLAALPLKGGAQGVPVPPGNPGMSGAVSQVRSLALQSGTAAIYGAIAGVGAEPIELGITAAGAVATPVAQLTSQTLANVATGIGLAKFAFDLSTFAYGYAISCN